MSRDAIHLTKINHAGCWVLTELKWDIPFTESFEKALKEYEPCITKIEKINITMVKSYNDIEVKIIQDAYNRIIIYKDINNYKKQWTIEQRKNKLERLCTSGTNI